MESISEMVESTVQPTTSLESQDPGEQGPPSPITVRRSYYMSRFLVSDADIPVPVVRDGWDQEEEVNTTRNSESGDNASSDIHIIGSSPTRGIMTIINENRNVYGAVEHFWWTYLFLPTAEPSEPPPGIMDNRAIHSRHRYRYQGFRERLRGVVIGFWAFIFRVRGDPVSFAYLFMNTFKILANVDLTIGGRAYLPLEWLFHVADDRLKAEVGREGERCLTMLMVIATLMIGAVAIIYFCLAEVELHNALMFLPTQTNLNYFQIVISVVALTDYTVKFLTILLKGLVAALPGFVLPYHKRRRIYHFIEMSSQLYRSLLPVCPWLVYFTSFSSWPSVFQHFGYIWALLYFHCKLFTDTRIRIRNWFESLKNLLQNIPSSSLGAGSMSTAVGICAICHDNILDPIRLQCQHSFCEKCVTTWFRHQHELQQWWNRNLRTCPLCRTKVVMEERMKFSDGSTLASKMCV